MKKRCHNCAGSGNVISLLPIFSYQACPACGGSGSIERNDPPKIKYAKTPIRPDTKSFIEEYHDKLNEANKVIAIKRIQDYGKRSR